MSFKAVTTQQFKLVDLLLKLIAVTEKPNYFIGASLSIRQYSDTVISNSLVKISSLFSLRICNCVLLMKSIGIQRRSYR